MVVAPKAGEAPVKPIDVWANQTQKSASWLGLDSPFFGATTIQEIKETKVTMSVADSAMSRAHETA